MQARHYLGNFLRTCSGERGGQIRVGSPIDPNSVRGYLSNSHVGIQAEKKWGENELEGLFNVQNRESDNIQGRFTAEKGGKPRGH